MLETIKEYAAERLEGNGQATAQRRRHAEWYCELAEGLISLPWQVTPRQSEAERRVQHLQDEYRNVQAALGWAWGNGEDELGVRLGVTCIRLWIERGLFHDAIAWLDVAVPKIPACSAGIQLRALEVAATIAFFVLADADEADRYWMRAIELAENFGEPSEIAWIQTMRAGVVWERGDLERALALRESHLASSRASGNRLSEANALHLLGEVLRDLGRYDEAERALRECDTIAREVGGRDLFIAANTHSLGDLALDRGDLVAALTLYRESVDQAHRLGSAGDIVACLAGIASVLAERKLDEEAATFWGAVCGAEEVLGFRMLAAERRRYEAHLDHLESMPAWIAGKALTVEEAVAAIPAAVE
jgi:tetratricopeptide (TPR) repeat protein